MATAPTLPLVSADDYFNQNLWKEWEFDNGVLVPVTSAAAIMPDDHSHRLPT